MQTIGEKIEEARKRKGISLSEASEATKIRSDFLQNIETNNYDYDLPEIYKRGFIKNYARFLKLNPDKILAQYQEQLISNNKKRKKDKANSDLFGSNLDLESMPKENSLDELTAEKQSYGTINIDNSTQPKGTQSTSDNSTKDVYIKTGIVGVSTLIFVLITIWLIKSIFSSSEVSTSVANSEALKDSTSEIVLSPNQLEIREVTIKATGPTYVIVRSLTDNKTLLEKNLNAGDIEIIKRKGKIAIAFTQGKFIELIADGNSPIRPNKEDSGKITLP